MKLVRNKLDTLPTDIPSTEDHDITKTPHKKHLYKIPPYFTETIEQMSANSKIEAEKFEPDTTIENTMIYPSKEPKPNSKL